MKFHVYIRTLDRFEPFIERVDNFQFDENNNLRLFCLDKMWFFPYSQLTYVFICDLKKEGEEDAN